MLRLVHKQRIYKKPYDVRELPISFEPTPLLREPNSDCGL